MATEVILLHETARQSWKSDTGTFLMFCTMMGASWLVGVTPFQVISALMFSFWVIVSSVSQHRRSRMTLDEARRRIDELERQAKGIF